MRELPEIAQGWIGTAVFSTDEERVQGAILWRLLANHPLAPAQLVGIVGVPEKETSSSSRQKR